MASVLSNYLANIMLASHFASGQTLYVALHIEDPTALGDVATELAGGDYTRVSTTFTAPGSKTTANATSLIFDDLPASIVTHFGVWDSLAAGHMYVAKELPSPITVTESGRIQVGVGDIAITL